MLQVLATNHQFLVLNKPAGIAVQADKTGDETLQQQAEAYCKHPVHAVNRVDRPATGLVLFAKSKASMTDLTRQFAERNVSKTYLAVVQNEPPAPEATLVHWLRKNEAKNISQVSETELPNTERAEMSYRLLGSSERYHLLEIQLITGRHHQIRAQLAAIGCPIKGDVKYGFRRGNVDRSIHLHAWRLAFGHPVSGTRVALEAPLPSGDSVWDFFKNGVLAEGEKQA